MDWVLGGVIVIGMAYLHSVRSSVVRIEHDKRAVEAESIMKQHLTYSVPIVSPASVSQRVAE